MNEQPAQPSRKIPLRYAVPGTCAAVLAVLAACYFSYKTGREAGMEIQRQRAFAKEGIPCPDQEPGTSGSNPHARPQPFQAIDMTGKTGTANSKNTSKSEIGLAITDCVRITWPMELINNDPLVGHPYIRLREGANRFAHLGHGVCEFVFKMKRAATIAVYLHCRGTDECSNSVFCRIDGGRMTFVDFGRRYNTWCWRPSYRRFHLKAGIHRLTLQACEDGIAIDRIALSTKPLKFFAVQTKSLQDLPCKPPPVFETLPVVSPSLPGIGAFAAQAMATESLVIGKGHANSITMFLRLNGAKPISGRIRIRSRRGRIRQTTPFTLTPDRRMLLLRFPLTFKPYNVYLVPVGIEVFAGNMRVHYQRIDFFRPLSWAFLGPFPDPKRKGVELELAPDRIIANLHKLPAIPGAAWKIIEDGSCYNQMGVIDLNRVFGLPNKPRLSRARERVKPMIAYAVTCVPSFINNHHQSLAYGGDDCIRAWHNGRPILCVNANMPLELSRMVMGTSTSRGLNTFVFKIAQTESYWQLLFEPDWSTPYGLQDFLMPLPVNRWK